jgi:hypothetical protein
VFFGIFWLGLVGNEERCQRWWVTAGSAVAGDGFFWFGSPSPVISLSLAYTLLLFYLVVI